MKILYAIQGTGNGHLSRAKEIIPYLQQYGNLDILISGTQVDLQLEQEVKYQFHGFSFVFGKNGGVDHYQSWKRMNLFQFAKDMKSVSFKDYDLIINDFEPITAWACKLQKIPSVSMGHQAAFQSPNVPRPKTIDWGKLILDKYAPGTYPVGFHFQKYDKHIYTPIIRSEIRNSIITNEGHYTVYLPAVDEKHLLPILHQIPHLTWEVFSKHSKIAFTAGNVSVQPIDNKLFNKSLASSEGLFTGGGFEGPAEALYLGKKLLVAPMRYQYEQQCNAYALKLLGIPVLWASNHQWLPVLKSFVATPQNHQFDFPNETESIVKMVIDTYSR